MFALLGGNNHRLANSKNQNEKLLNLFLFVDEVEAVNCLAHSQFLIITHNSLVSFSIRA